MTGKASQKIHSFLILICLFFLVLVARLFHLQIIQGESYLERSESNFIQERIIKHSRGKILDKEGRALADNRPAYDLYVTFALLPDSFKNLRAIAQPLNIPIKDLHDIDRELLAMAAANVDQRIILKSNLLLDHCKKVAEISRIKMIPGVNFERIFYAGKELCQVSVETKEISEQHSNAGAALRVTWAERGKS